MNLELTPQQNMGTACRAPTFLKSVLVISSSTVLSRILGLVRDVVIAHLFGASRAYDAYLIAFMIPHLLRRLLAEGALSSAFIPIFTARLTKDGPKQAERFANTVFTAALVFFAVLTVLGIFLAPFYVPFFADGFSREQLDLTDSTDADHVPVHCASGACSHRDGRAQQPREILCPGVRSGALQRRGHPLGVRAAELLRRADLRARRGSAARRPGATALSNPISQRSLALSPAA
jgi:hypothetical protein